MNLHAGRFCKRAGSEFACPPDGHQGGVTVGSGNHYPEEQFATSGLFFRGLFGYKIGKEIPPRGLSRVQFHDPIRVYRF